MLVGIAIGTALLGSGEAQSQESKTAPKKGKGKLGVRPIEPDGFVNTTGWKVTVNLNSADRTYRDGDEVIIKVTSEKSGYLYIFNVLPNQEAAVCIFPNNKQKDNKISGGQEVELDKFKAREPAGKEGILAVVINHPSTVEELRAENLTRGRSRSVSRTTLKKLVLEDGMGSKVQAIKDKPDKPLDIRKEQEQVQQTQSKEQIQKKKREWASAVVEVEIVAKTEQTKPDQERSPKKK